MHVHDISFIGWIHTIACLAALATGAWNLSLPKGTLLHRVMGRSYVWSMIVVNVSAFAIYRFDIAHFAPFSAGPHVFGFFHWLAIAGLIFVLTGAYAGRHQNRAFWAYVHPIAMLLSYYDLIGGGINEVFERIDPLRTLARASAKTVAGSAVNAPIIGMVQTAAMAATFLLIIYFIAKTALYRRSLRVAT